MLRVLLLWFWHNFAFVIQEVSLCLFVTLEYMMMLEAREIDLSYYFDKLEDIDFSTIREYDDIFNKVQLYAITIYKDKISNQKSLEEFLVKIEVLEEKRNSCDDLGIKDIISQAQVEMREYCSNNRVVLSSLRKSDFEDIFTTYRLNRHQALRDFNIDEIVELSLLDDKRLEQIPLYDKLIICTTEFEIFWIAIFYPM